MMVVLVRWTVMPVWGPTEPKASQLQNMAGAFGSLEWQSV